MSAADENGNMEPKKDCLSLTDTRALLKYVWTGALLPVDRDSYNFRVGLENVDGDLDGMINNLIKVYGDVHGHCKKFKDDTYPNIVAIASTIYDFAQTAGGTTDDSYYANILAAGASMYAELAKPAAKQNQAKIAECKETVQGLIDAQLQNINTLRTQATDAKKALSDFEEICKGDQSSLETVAKPIRDKLEGEGGEITRIRGEIEDKKKELEADQAEYEKDIIVAATAVSYMWFFPIGTIAAAVVMGVYSDKARKMLATIEAIKQILENDGKELARDIKMMSDLGLMKADLQNVIDQIGPAVAAIEKMEGVWGAIADDLGSVGDAVRDQSAKGNLIVQKLSQKKIVTRWNDLAAEADNYRKVAYVVDPKVVTIDKAISDYQQVVNSAPAA